MLGLSKNGIAFYKSLTNQVCWKISNYRLIISPNQQIEVSLKKK